MRDGVRACTILTMRAEAVYRGRVQGVGFRAAAHHLAQRHEVVGWVRNEADGAVRLVAEGDAERIEAFLDDLRAQMGPNIRDEQMHTGEDRGGYNGFEIRY